MKTRSVFIGVVVPVYQGEEFVSELCARLHRVLAAINERYSIVLVDDASPDGAWKRIQAEVAKDDRVLGIQLSRNFGQHYAITAGLDHLDAEWVVVMDGDLQDPPEEIPLLLAKAKAEDFDVVIAERETSEVHIGRKIGSYVFNTSLRYLSALDMNSRHGNFRIMSRKVHEAFQNVREHMRFYPAIMQWIGFRIGHQNTSRAARQSGRSSYSLTKLVRLAVQATVAYSERPLHISIILGLVISAVAAILGLVVILRKIVWGIDVDGWASLFTVVVFLGGLQIFLLGIVGLYIGKAFQEAKKRPLYIVRAIASAPEHLDAQVDVRKRVARVRPHTSPARRSSR